MDVDHLYDVVVIGGGPSGMMAACIASLKSSKVLLIEQNTSLGKKLLITGHGRCNITTSNINIDDFILKLGRPAKFLYSSMIKFGVTETIEFFNDILGVQTKVERGARVFPVSNSSKEVLDALVKFLLKNKVKILLNTKVKKINILNKCITSVDVLDKQIYGKNFIIATGGLSYPTTGSDGNGFKLIEKLNHKITKLYPALTPIICKDNFLKNLEGLSLKNVAISIYDVNNKKIISRFGEALFTSNGMSGPIILEISSYIVDLISNGLRLSIDFKPAMTSKQLDDRLQRDFLLNKNKMFKNSLDDLFPQKLIPVILDLSGISSDKYCHSITKNERALLLDLCKNFCLNISNVEGFHRAIITKGGVSLKEIDSRNMKSKLFDNLYFAGEMIDLNGPTGGYNLQICWTTGYISGNVL